MHQFTSWWDRSSGPSWRWDCMRLWIERDSSWAHSEQVLLGGLFLIVVVASYTAANVRPSRGGGRWRCGEQGRVRYYGRKAVTISRGGGYLQSFGTGIRGSCTNRDSSKKAPHAELSGSNPVQEHRKGSFPDQRLPAISTFSSLRTAKRHSGDSS